MDCGLTDSSIHGILQARILQWVAIPFSMGSSPPRDQTQVSHVSCIGRHVFFTTTATWEALGLQWDLRICTPNTFPGSGDVVPPGTLSEALILSTG